MALTAFRMGELQRKMQEAANRQDYETAIKYRDELRAMRAENPEPELPAGPKVVNITNGEEYVAPPKPEPGEPVVDHDAIDVLELALDKFREGKAFGLAVLIGTSDGDGRIDDVHNAISDKAIDYPRLFIGGAHTLAHDILQLEDESYDVETEEYPSEE